MILKIYHKIVYTVFKYNSFHYISFKIYYIFFTLIFFSMLVLEDKIKHKIQISCEIFFSKFFILIDFLKIDRSL